MPAHLWLWPGSHRLMEQVLNSNSERGQHAAGADFYIGSLQRLAGMREGDTITPVDRVVGGGQACAFLGHVVHAGSESQCAVATHYRWHLLKMDGLVCVDFVRFEACVAVAADGWISVR
mmetsp:Transcript_9744/g.22755  ORF Transcript_9744/g.22755 Transcript_9744/m.22755 type:complete len:119 (+) Transcript_9744:1168-1524(+)